MTLRTIGPRLGLLATIVCLICAAVSGCRSREANSDYIRLEGHAIGTTYRVTARARPEQAEQITSALKQVFERANASMSIFDSTSLLSRLNRNQTDSLDRYIYTMLEMAARVRDLSGGHYDVTVKPLVEAWGFAGLKPTREPNLDSLLRFVGFDKISFDRHRLRKSDPRVQIDLNSIAKGYTVDLAAETVERFGIEDYLVEIGGEIRCRGINPSGRKWSVGIDSPFDGNMLPGENTQVVLELTDCGLATSGNYRRFYIDEQGRKIAHTIDPITGRSAVSRLLSATVVAESSAMADALGTMFMSLGLEESQRVAALLEPQVLVYLVYSDEGHDAPGNYNVWCSHDMEKMIRK